MIKTKYALRDKIMMWLTKKREEEAVEEPIQVVEPVDPLEELEQRKGAIPLREYLTEKARVYQHMAEDNPAYAEKAKRIEVCLRRTDRTNDRPRQDDRITGAADAIEEYYQVFVWKHIKKIYNLEKSIKEVAEERDREIERVKKYLAPHKISTGRYEVKKLIRRLVEGKDYEPTQLIIEKKQKGLPPVGRIDRKETIIMCVEQALKNREEEEDEEIFHVDERTLERHIQRVVDRYDARILGLLDKREKLYEDFPTFLPEWKEVYLMITQDDEGYRRMTREQCQLVDRIYRATRRKE